MMEHSIRITDMQKFIRMWEDIYNEKASKEKSPTWKKYYSGAASACLKLYYDLEHELEVCESGEPVDMKIMIKKDYVPTKEVNNERYKRFKS